MSDLVSYKTDGNVAIITLNRPKAANALSTELLDHFNAIINLVNNETNINCAIITGAGEKAFCAGADLKERRGMTEQEVTKAVKYIGHTINAVEKLRIPVIAAINGVALGGGLELALACDIRIAVHSAKLGLTETSLAIIPGAGGTQRLPRLIGIGQAKKLIYTAKTITAGEALSIGLVEEVTEEEQLLYFAMELAKSIAANGPIALEQAKVAINKGIEVDLATALEVEHLAYRVTIPTADRLEGLNAFREKRKPIYKGK